MYVVRIYYPYVGYGRPDLSQSYIHMIKRAGQLKSEVIAATR